MNSIVVTAAFVVGLVSVVWTGIGFVGASAMALAMTVLIAGVYLLGAFELRQFRAATASLVAALAGLAQAPPELGDWLDRVHPSLRNAVRLRIEGERAALPGPALTPYLVGLLVMLGMLGTFLGMIVTFRGAVFALEGSADLQSIRSALSAPIKGLGLAFGTSVAGVAASAMLGFMSAVSRRERARAAGDLDARIADVLRPLSLVHQRQEAYRALQTQAQALPAVVDRLQALVEHIERRDAQLGEQLLQRQERFHQNVSVAYTGLADAVGRSLQDSLSLGARAAGESLRPVVEAAMSGIAQESQRLHRQVSEATQAQLTGLTSEFAVSARTVSDAWTRALDEQARTSERLVDGLDRSLGAFTGTFEQRSGALLAAVEESLSRSQSEQQASDRLRLQAWVQALESTAATLGDQWQQASAQAVSVQQAVCAALERTAGEIGERASGQARQTLDETARLLAGSEELVRARIAAEADWTAQQAQRMDTLVGLLRAELGALRDDEAVRGSAAVERLGELQAALADHLAALGSALEAPMTRLIQTASEAPQAAAEVIAQLRQEMTRLGERDNLALEERAGLMTRLAALLETLDRTATDQRAAIESLTAASATALEQAGGRFAQIVDLQAGRFAQTVDEQAGRFEQTVDAQAGRFELTVDAQAGRAEAMAVQVTGSAVELSSLGEALQVAVGRFSEANEKLIDGLRRVEDAVGASMARSDEQLAYYVSQAREVIDLSLTSQRAIVEDLRRLHDRAAASPQDGR